MEYANKQGESTHRVGKENVSSNGKAPFNDNRTAFITQAKWIDATFGKTEKQEVVQRLMDEQHFREASQTGFGRLLRIETRPDNIRAIDVMIRGYHEINDTQPPQVLYNQRSERLHQLQTHVFGLGYDAKSGHHGAMIELLDDIQNEQRILSNYQIDNNLNLWVPGREAMEAIEQEDLDALWTSIVNGHGQLVITETVQNFHSGENVQVVGFKRNILANLSRIMSTRSGRRLLGALNEHTPDHDHPTTIRPTIDGQPRDEILGGTAFGGIKTYSPQLSGKDVENEDGTPGDGFGTTLSFLGDLHDSEMVDYDEDENEILSPSFIGLAHELMHTLHDRRGMAWSKTRPAREPARYESDGDRAVYDNAEEFHTIAYTHHEAVVPIEHITENMLREESGVARRYGHRSRLR